MGKPIRKECWCVKLNEESKSLTVKIKYTKDLEKLRNQIKAKGGDPERLTNSILRVRRDIDNLNLDKSYSSFIIPSEELSLHNLYGKNIHALILNNKSFLPGAGDGAEKPFHFDCNYDTLNLYDDLEEHALCIAAHPFSPVPILQKLFFNSKR